MEHRIGGLEKANITGNVNQDPENHHLMCNLRAEKIMNVQKVIPDLEVDGDESGELLVLGWGGTQGSILDAVIRAREQGFKVSLAHLKYLNPLPKNTGKVLSNFKHVLIPELNLGQLAHIIRKEYLKDVITLSKMKGLPFKSSEIHSKISELLGGGNGN